MCEQEIQIKTVMFHHFRMDGMFICEQCFKMKSLLNKEYLYKHSIILRRKQNNTVVMHFNV